MTLRILFMVVTANRMKVEKHWERPLKSDVKEEETYLPVAKGPGKPQRREDMTGVGKPIAPTAKSYPVDRAVCRHRHENQETALKAAGGRNNNLATGVLEPWYTWTCTRCGSRWEITQRSDGPAQTTSTGALQPSCSSTSPLDVPMKVDGAARVDPRQQRAGSTAPYPNPETVAIQRQRSPEKYEQTEGPMQLLVPEVMMIHSDASLTE